MSGNGITVKGTCGSEKGKRRKNMERDLRVLELFSGIGGMHFAFCYAGIPTSHTPVDINQSANEIIVLNFPEVKKKLIKKSICDLDLPFFESFDVWTMSPPCQPYTQQSSAKKRDHLDRRADALSHLIKILSELSKEKLPSAIILENVRPFGTSESWNQLSKVLENRQYEIKTFHISPRQFGFPNERNRFYAVARLLDRWPSTRQPSSYTNIFDDVYFSPSVSEFLDSATPDPSLFLSKALLSKPAAYCFDIVAKDFFQCCVPPSAGKEQLSQDSTPDPETSEAPIIDNNSAVGSSAELISNDRIKRNINACLAPDHRHGSITVPPHPFKLHTACFTKSYGRFIQGTGSILLESDELHPSKRQKTEQQCPLSPSDFGKDVGVNSEFDIVMGFGRLRYFSSTEVSHLMGFKTMKGTCPITRCPIVSQCDGTEEINDEVHLCLPIPHSRFCRSEYLMKVAPPLSCL